MNIKAVAFTGHRPKLLPFSVESMTFDHARLESVLYDHISRFAGEGCERFYCGGAVGTDIVFGEIVVMVRKEAFPNIKLICAIPFIEQSRMWNSNWRRRYDNLLNDTDERIVLSERYYKGCFHERNRFMVNNSDALIAVYNGCDTGGTAYTVKYAKSLGREVVIIDPNNL